MTTTPSKSNVPHRSSHRPASRQSAGSFVLPKISGQGFVEVENRIAGWEKKYNLTPGSICRETLRGNIVGENGNGIGALQFKTRMWLVGGNLEVIASGLTENESITQALQAMYTLLAQTMRGIVAA